MVRAQRLAGDDDSGLRTSRSATDVRSYRDRDLESADNETSGYTVTVFSRQQILTHGVSKC